MRRLLTGVFALSMFSLGATAAAKGPEVDLVDNKLSINVESIPLSRLLELVDRATGMKSKVPNELANRNVSAKFSGLTVTAGVRKMFEGQPLDYVMIEGQGIIVTAASLSTSGAESLPQYNPPPQQPIDQPFVQEFPQIGPPPIQQQGQPQPAMVQTPFGPIPNPRAQQQPNAPLNAPGQQNPLFQQNGQPPLFQQNGQPINGQPQGVPGVNPNPFGAPSPFGIQNQPPTNQNNPLFPGGPVVISPTNQPR